eukprot:3795383-Lingulodinium_polyedra.AAC.1
MTCTVERTRARTMDCTIGSPVVYKWSVVESTTGSSVEYTANALVGSTVGPLMEPTVVSIVESRDGSIVGSTLSLHRTVQRFPQCLHNKHNCWLCTESTTDCTMVSTMANTEELTVV